MYRWLFRTTKCIYNLLKLSNINSILIYIKYVYWKILLGLNLGTNEFQNESKHESHTNMNFRNKTGIMYLSVLMKNNQLLQKQNGIQESQYSQLWTWYYRLSNKYWKDTLNLIKLLQKVGKSYWFNNLTTS